MNERVRRPILSLKLGSTPALPPEAAAPRPPVPAPAPEPATPAYTWKCRPCGTAFVPPAEGPDDEAVRCPSCNARLGKAGDFRLDPPPLEKLRARAVKAAPPAPAPVVAPRLRGPRTRPPVVTVRVLKKVR
jgi:DNA-directed RNA polymerase subunit RPC12/RpoP